ncbi:MAG: hypothetical protein VKO01_11695 [Cyanobacteriota bacterium]|jgi:hypothetical protein|nr:hypothetical protein [Cyanobacteriota bacterium]
MSDVSWSEVEKEIARAAFEKAYEREIAVLIEEVRTQVTSLAELEDLWRLNDFLSARRHDVDGKYDYRYAVLVFVFSRLVKEGWLQIEELDGLEQTKLSKIAALSRM